MDVFVCAQFRGERPLSKTCPNATDVGKFDEVIQSCDRLCLYSTTIDNPKVLSRVWCLYEVMSAIRCGIPVMVILSSADQDQLRDMLLHDFDKIITLFSAIKSEQAEATFEKDRIL